MEFWKYSGAGNDFILFDGAMREKFSNKEILELCDRRNGIGADGMLFVTKAANDVDFKMNYFNADGAEVEMCGNGARACVHWFATKYHKECVTFTTFNGSHYQGRLLAKDRAEVTMDECKDVNKLDVSDFYEVEQSIYLNTGVPHAVYLLSEDQNLEDDSWIKSAPNVRHDARFEKGVNVNFAKKIDHETYALRTFERGVEGETLACGTGAMALARLLQMKTNKNVFQIQVRGGILTARFDQNHWWLSGPIKCVFHGEIDL